MKMGNTVIDVPEIPVRTKFSERTTGTRVFLSPKELLTLLEVARADSLRDWLMILVSYRHGLRAGEVTALRTTDIVEGSFDIKRLKGSKQTIQPIEGHRGEPLLNEEKGLKEWLRARPQDSGDALFPSNKGGCLSPKSFNFIFHKYAAKAGLPAEKSHPHCLKHTTATHLIRAGVDLAYVQTRLGHASITSTQKYVHLNDSEVAEKTRNALMSVFD